jgi:hypothetical protein
MWELYNKIVCMDNSCVDVQFADLLLYPINNKKNRLIFKRLTYQIKRFKTDLDLLDL